MLKVKLWRKTAALALVMALVISLVPGQVFAEEVAEIPLGDEAVTPDIAPQPEEGTGGGHSAQLLAECCSVASPHTKADKVVAVKDGETHYYALSQDGNMTITNADVAAADWSCTSATEGMFKADYPQTDTKNKGVKFRTLTTPGTAVFTGTTASGSITVTIIVGDPGTTPEPEVDRTALNAAITAAEAIDVNAVETSVDGTDVPAGKQWVTQTVKDNLTTALAEAKAVAVDAVQAVVTAAAEKLQAAVDAWAPAPGTQHVHTWSETWANDATHHWHECTAEPACDVTDNAGKDGYGAHAEDAGTVTKEATATEAGEKTYKCTTCQRVLRTEPIPATGTVEPDPPTPGTCPNNCSPANPHAEDSFAVKDGEVHYYTLNRNSNMKITNADVTGWTWTADPAGMFKVGYPEATGDTVKFRTTATPGTAVFTGTTATGTITVTIITQDVNAHTHVWAETVEDYPSAAKAEDFATDGWLIATPATCTADGQMVRKCTAADCTLTPAELTQTITATGHSWGEWQVVEAATCQKAGTQKKTCANDPSHTAEEAIAQLSHVDANGDALCDNGCGAVVNTVLEQAIDAAESAKSGVVEAADGSAISSTVTWATSEVFAALNTAIETAQAALTTAVTAQAVLDAAQAMKAATADFAAAVKPGEKAPACDCGPLNPHKTYVDNSQVISIDIGEQGAEHWIELKGLKKDGSLEATGRFLVKGYGTEHKNERAAFSFDPTGIIDGQDKQDTVSQRLITVAKGDTTATVTVDVTNEDGTTGTQNVSIKFHVVDTTSEEVTVTFQDADGAQLATSTAANRIGKTLADAAIEVPTVTPGEGQAFKGWYVVDADGSVTDTLWDPATDTLKSKTLTLRAVTGKAYQVRYFLMENGVATAKPVPGLSSTTGVADPDATSVTVTAPAVAGYIVADGQTTQTVDLTKAAPGVTFYYQKAYETGTQHLVPTDAAGTAFAPITIAAAPDATLELVPNNADLGLTATIHNTMGVAVAADGKSLVVDATKVTASTAASTVYVKATTPAAEPGGEAQVTYYYLTVEPPKQVTVTYSIDDGSQNKKPGKANKFDAAKLTIPEGGVLSADSTKITFNTYAGAPLPILSGEYPTHGSKQFAGWNMTAGTLTTETETYSYSGKAVNIPKAPYEAGELRVGDQNVTLVTGWRNFKGYLKILAVDTKGNDMHIERLLNLTRQRKTEDYGFKTESVQVNDYDAIQIDFCYDNKPSVDVDLSFLNNEYTLLGFYYHEKAGITSAIQRNADVKDAGSWQLVTVPSSDAENGQTETEAPVVNLILAKSYTVKYHVPEEAGVTMKDNVDEQTFVKEHLPDDPGDRTKVVNDLAVFAESAELLELPKSLDPDRSIVGWYAEDGSHYGTSGFIDLTQDLSQLDTDSDRVINLYANYVRAGKKYVIHYDANLPGGLPEGTVAGNMSTDAQGESDTGSFEFTAAAKPTLAGYVFKGWSLNDPDPAEGATLYQPGGKITLTDPDAGLAEIKGTLYAIWEPSYTVTYTDGVDGKVIFADQTYSATAGTATPAFVAGTESGNPERVGYTFKGWSPALADTVSADATYQATWALRTDLSYTVNYLEKDTDKVLNPAATVTDQTYGTDVTVSPIAITGYVTPGTQKITIDVANNVVNFYYTKRTDISYTVKYLEKDTEKVLSPEKKVTGKTFEETVTETAVDVTGYVKPAESKSLTLGVADNVITFYYTKRTDLSYTAKYLEQGTNAVLHGPTTVTGQTYQDQVTVTPIAIEGYKAPANQTVTIGVTGNEVTFYYTKRADLSYTVNYLEKVGGGADKVLADPKTVTAQTYQDTVTVQPIDIAGYVKPEAQEITIAVENNVVNFYYTKRADLSYTVNYLEKVKDGEDKILREHDIVTGQTYQAEVTVTPADIAGYTSPAAQTIKIEVSGNVVNFYYTKRTDLSYTVNYLEKVEGEADKVLHDPKTVTGQTYQAKVTVDPVAIDGYTSPDAQTITIAVADNVVNFYYTKRADLSYTVNYLEKVDGAADKVLRPARTINNQTYQAEVTVEPVAIDGYTSPAAQTITIGVADNVVNFYYTPIMYTVEYDVNGGTTTSTQLKFENLRYGEATPTINEPTKAADADRTYFFSRWDPVFSDKVTGNVKYTAVWADNQNEYTVTYDLDGNLTTTEDQVKFENKHYGDPTPTIPDPTKAEDATSIYDFAGWGPGFSDKVTGDTVYVPQWTNHYKSYDVIYMVGDQEVDRKSVVYDDEVTVAGKPVMEGYDIGNWICEDNIVDISDGHFKMPAHNVTLTASKTAKEYTVTYEVDGETVGTPASVAYGANVTVAEPYVKEGYVVTGWTCEGLDISSGSFTMPAKNVVLTAQSTVQRYTVTYLVDGVTVKETKDVAYGTNVTVAAPYVKEGYDVTDWTTGDATIVSGHFNMPAKNVKLTATSEVHRYKVIYKVNGTVIGTPEEVAYDTTVRVAAKYVKEGYDITDWTTGNATITNGSFVMPANDVILTATATIQNYTVEYDLAGGTTTSERVKFDHQHYGDTTPTINEPTKAEDDTYTYTFAGWSPAVSEKVTGQVTYTAQWTPVYKNYTVEYDLAGGTTTSAKTVFENLHYGEATPTIDEPTKAADGTYNHYFAGWSPAVSDTVTGNVTYVAQWSNDYEEYTVEYDLAGGTTTSEQVKFEGKHYGEATPTIAEPTKTADNTFTYAFAGWSPAVSNTVKGNVKYEAQWTPTYKNYTVGYDLDGDVTTTDDQKKFEKHYGDPTPTIEPPTKPEDNTYTYEFAGWSPAVSPTVTQDVTYTAQWTPVYKSYTVKYDLAGGATDAPTEYTNLHYGADLPDITPTRADDDTYTYTFAGWGPDYTGKVTGSATYTAQWTKTLKSHKVNYDLAGGKLPEGTSNPGSYTPEDPDFTLNNPVRDGYVFEGWTGTDLSEKPTVTVTVDTADNKEKTFTANWLVDVLVDVTEDVNGDVIGDGVADKYQVKLVYKAGANGTVTGKTEKVITLKDGEGNFVERLEDQIPGVEGVTVTPGSRYNANGWDVDPTTAMTYEGGKTYEFTAQFSYAGGGGGGGGYVPKPSKPVEEELEDPDVPLAGLPQLNTKDHVAYLIGRPDGTIAPTDSITRGEVATIFFRLLSEESRNANWSTSCSYWDMDGTEYYYTPVSTVTKAGLIKGYTDGSFGGGNRITRAEMATIAAQFLSDPYSGENLFTDIDGHWAAEYINRAAKAGWFKTTYDNGDSVGNFRPNDYITRAEVVVMINRMLGRKPDRDHLLPDMKTWPDNVDTPATAWYYLDMQEASNSHDYTKDDTKPYEVWVNLIANPDWAALERR